MKLKVRAHTSSTLGRMNAGLRVIESMQARVIADEVGEMVVAQTSHRFTTTKRDPEGYKWAPWSIDYAFSKLRRSTPGGRLVLFGLLRKSIKSKVSDWGGKDRAIARIGPSPSGITEEVAEYADIHQFGSREKNGKGMRARPYMGLSDGDKKAIEGAMVRRFRSAFGW